MTDKEQAEAFVFPASDFMSPEEIKAADAEFSAFRANRAKAMTEQERQMGRLLQLKFIMEDYLRSDKDEPRYTFGYFLRDYLHSLNIKSIELAQEISVHITKLSRLLNDREAPNERILVRLEMHSDGLVPAILWYRLLEKQKVLLLQNNKRLRKEERKFVKRRFGKAA